MGSEGFETKKIFVGGIPRTVNEDEFGTFFSHFGEIKEHRIIRDHSTGGSRGFGFITFQTEQAVDDILGMGNKLDFAGVQVDIKKAVPKKPNVAPPPSKHYSRPAYGHSRYAGFGAPISTHGTSVVGSTYSSRSAHGHIRYYGFAFGGSGTGGGLYSYKGASYSMSGYYRGYGNAGGTTCFTPRRIQYHVAK
ncbi:hypothetical protein M0R45_033600 [Rubus argutus]|uniref:RRM domain-containing protein n=1 Tax=Rubus argutus TaxID=59490 RepID=A0AAW1WNB2_RUBAR